MNEVTVSRERIERIANEAHTMGRIYNRLGEKEKPSEVCDQLTAMIDRELQAALSADPADEKTFVNSKQIFKHYGADGDPAEERADVGLTDARIEDIAYEVYDKERFRDTDQVWCNKHWLTLFARAIEKECATPPSQAGVGCDAADALTYQVTGEPDPLKREDVGRSEIDRDLWKALRITGQMAHQPRAFSGDAERIRREGAEAQAAILRVREALTTPPSQPEPVVLRKLHPREMNTDDAYLMRIDFRSNGKPTHDLFLGGIDDDGGLVTVHDGDAIGWDYDPGDDDPTPTWAIPVKDILVLADHPAPDAPKANDEAVRLLEKAHSWMGVSLNVGKYVEMLEADKAEVETFLRQQQESQS